MYVNSSQVAAIWLETPLDEKIGTRMDGETVNGRSSAYLNIQLPSPNSTVGVLATCSIDARWVRSHVEGTGVAQVSTQAVYQAPYIRVADSAIFPALDDGNWKTVRLRKAWLDDLTSQLGDGPPGWNTAASIISSMVPGEETGIFVDWTGIVTNITQVISAIVTDGMSRVGYEQNGGTQNNTELTWPTTNDDRTRVLDAIIKGTFELPNFFGPSNSDAPQSKMYCSVTVSGLGYRLYSTAYYLAATVLLAHVLLASCHVAWVLYSRDTSNGWDSITDVIILALGSRPPNAGLHNTTVGIERYKTLQNLIQIRVVDSAGSSNSVNVDVNRSTSEGRDGGKLRMMLVDRTKKSEEHEMVAIDQKY